MSADSYEDCPQCKKEEGVREYREIYIEDEVVKVSYNGACYCGFEVAFDYEHPFKIDPDISAKADADRMKAEKIQVEKQTQVLELKSKRSQLAEDIVDLGGTP